MHIYNIGCNPTPMTVTCNAQIYPKIFGLHYWLLGNKYIPINKEVIKFGCHILSPSGVNIRTKHDLSMSEVLLLLLLYEVQYFPQHWRTCSNQWKQFIPITSPLNCQRVKESFMRHFLFIKMYPITRVWSLRWFVQQADIMQNNVIVKDGDSRVIAGSTQKWLNLA